MKLKVGDKVRIRKDLEIDRQYGFEVFIKDMSYMRGKTATIDSIFFDGNKFTVKGCPYNWTAEMFAGKEKGGKLIFRDNATILLKDGKRYVTKCQAGDTYDREKGLLLCLAKANGYTYNDICEMLNNAEYQGKKPDAVKSNGVREVERSAKVGEYIKIVKADMSDGCYNNGEIYKVIGLGQSRIVLGVYINTEITHFCCIKENRYGQSFVCDSEYVVLEGYKPYKITLSEFWANKGKKDMAIHCKTDNEADELLKAFDRVGQVWNSGDKYTKLNMGGEDAYYTNHNSFYFGNDIDDIMVYEFNEVDLCK